MSVSGLYDSEIGDKMAQKTLRPFREAVKESHRRKRKKCACGNEVARPYIVRGLLYVCKQCADKTPRRRSGTVATHKCAKCKKIMTRLQLVMRRSKMYCKQCANKV